MRNTATPVTTPPLQHIAIIPDGNRRWATARGIPAWDGIRTGVQTAEKIFEALRRRRIPWCTFWASSYDNLTKRPAQERVILNELFAQWFTQLAENRTIHAEHVRVRVLGEWPDLLLSAAREAIQRVLERTVQYRESALTFLIGYDGDRELAAATTSLLRACGRNEETADAITMERLRAHAWTKDLPEVDLLLRTGSWEDPHRSANFLPLRTSNVQEAYPAVYWPAFSEEELDHVLADYQRRTRRLGT